ncbi:hypothetical protein [Pseudomonas mandelii]|uniref:hypothetical protein n=1 Tax=Pseudomonas mandelii TaxID=75612 RepID=UPI0020A0F2EB|nr:hypothetical protein [Pseudomonas mandelii]MCO8313042.1 hypothetical protein [Pseudomonas mandelii]
MKNIDCSLAGCEKRASLREREAEDDKADTCMLFVGASGASTRLAREGRASVLLMYRGVWFAGKPRSYKGGGNPQKQQSRSKAALLIG